MTTVLLVLGALVIIAGAVYFAMKSGKIEDKNGNNIPDVVEQKVEQVKEVVAEVKEVAEKVKKVATPKKPAAKRTSTKKK
jgi:uncharacterized protein YoxC